MWVKICANTNLEDTALAIELGADAIGFVFAASQRQVTVAQAAAITARLPAGAERVGVFHAHDPEQIADVALAAGLTAVQLHGGFDEELLVRLGERLAGKVRVIQTLHWPVGEESSTVRLGRQIERIAQLGVADRVLIDSKVGPALGGTGVAFDWAAAREVFESATNGVRLILAGGLRPDNVAQAIGQGLGSRMGSRDVARGVEVSPGHKDPERLRHFIENARATP